MDILSWPGAEAVIEVVVEAEVVTEVVVELFVFLRPYVLHIRSEGIV